MTFGEIYDRVCFKIWGSSTVPQGSAAVLQGNTGMIADSHRKIQQLYNFWFMQGYTSFATVADLQAYPLPADYKELITVQFKVQDDTYFKSPMSPLGIAEAQHFKWNKNAESVEYPEWYELIGESIVLYPAPSEDDYYFHMTYWGFLPRPPTATFDTEYDELTMYGSDAIINYTVSQFKMILEEYQSADYYKNSFLEDMEILKREDVKRRQVQIAEVLTSDGL